jgi:hypothetical protein
MLKTVSSLGNFANVTITSTDSGAAAGPLLELYRDSASPAASDTIGEIEFNGKDSAGNKQQYALIHGSILSPTSTTEQGQIHFETATAGASTEKMIIGTTNLVINEIGAVFNVRIEGDTDANLFYTDATNSRVGVGTISPAQKLDVAGAIQLSDNLIPSTAAKGVNFTANTPAAGMTSQLFNAYETGTFTPVFSNLTVVGTLTLTGTYVRQGRMVFINLRIVSTTSTSSTVGVTLSNSGFPFVSADIYTNVSAINTGTFATFANGGLFGFSGGNTILYTPTWTAVADVTITGYYFV